MYLGNACPFLFFLCCTLATETVYMPLILTPPFSCSLLNPRLKQRLLAQRKLTIVRICPYAKVSYFIYKPCSPNLTNKSSTRYKTVTRQYIPAIYQQHTVIDARSSGSYPDNHEWHSFHESISLYGPTRGRTRRRGDRYSRRTALEKDISSWHEQADPAHFEVVTSL